MPEDTQVVDVTPQADATPKTDAFNPEAASLAELRDQVVREDSAGRQRDENGRFVSQNPPKEGDSVEKPAEFIREIDLGDGSGKQVFKGATWEELADKLADAQKNATKLIREQASKLKEVKPVEIAKPAEPELSADEEFLISQELLSSPTKGLATLFEKMTGHKLSDLKTSLERLKAIDKAESREAIGDQFVRETPDFYPDPDNKNRATFLNYFEGAGKDVDALTLDDFKKAYSFLDSHGLLLKKGENTTTETTRIAEPPQRTSSGHSPGGRNYTPPKATLSAEEELGKLSLAELRVLSKRELAKQGL